MSERRTGMTSIVMNTTKLVTGLIAVFGIYIALTGHISPGGGFAGGVILAAAGVLVVLAFGGKFSQRLVTESHTHVWDAAGAAGFLVVGLCGYFTGGFFMNFVPLGKVHKLFSGGMIPLSNLAILVKVGAGLLGAFLALSAFRPTSGPLHKPDMES
ncbi:MAG: hypothetical protein HQ546_01240 [Planctomycetes bacterium]|nr:hypothetical protein [Planctomycetota bacterium]